jgi:hypothetical protein
MRRSLITTALAGGLALSPVTAEAAVVASWQLDEAPKATTMVDSASLGGTNNGVIHNVETGVAGLVSGKAYRFDGPQDYVEVADDPDLDPGTANITATAIVRADNKGMPSDSYDIIRKGVVTTAGGEWKMEIKRTSDPLVGRLHCVFKGVLPDGTASTVQRTNGVDLIDGNIHTLKCVKTATAVSAVVDGKAAAITKAAGSIANNQPVIVGAKTASDDVLQGVLDNVTIDIT